jgi:phosphatidylglycerophosphatase A
MILSLAKILATGAGIGYVPKGSGTMAALATCGLWYIVFHHQGSGGLLASTCIILIFVLGVWSASKVEKLWGKDNSRVVIDEIGGMCVSLFMVPVQIPYMLIGFIMFRFFDIAKPLFIGKAEKLPGGWGVMADDLLAGICSNVLLQLIARNNPW